MYSQLETKKYRLIKINRDYPLNGTNEVGMFYLKLEWNIWALHHSSLLYLKGLMSVMCYLFI